MFCIIITAQISIPGNRFFVDSWKDEFNNIYIGGYFPVNETSYPNIKFLPRENGTNYECLTGMYNSGANNIELSTTNCWEDNAVVCVAFEYQEPNCSTVVTQVEKSIFELMLDPDLQDNKTKALQQIKFVYKDMMKRLDQTKSFKALFSNLWYATLPCYDIKDVTSKRNGERAVLKYCEWKGVAISCAAIFNTFPTDRGMCCSFNMKAADEIFQGETYPQLVKQLQDSDNNSSFTKSEVPKWYSSNHEPTSLPGRNKGLVLILDSHSDMFSAGSVDSDFDEFMGLISPSDSFPLMNQEAFEIRPGHNNIITLTGSQVNANEDLRSLDQESRRCIFSDENSGMKIYKNYSYVNCIFECSLFYARDQLQLKNNASYACIPWYFPSSEKTITVCDPWETNDFLKFMSNLPDDTCGHCLPDCSTTIYDANVITIPFRKCDSYNLGVSLFCSVGKDDPIQPPKLAYQVAEALKLAGGENKAYITSMESNMRKYGNALEKDAFNLTDSLYDAYEKDIAMVQIYFKKSTIFEMGSKPRMNWIDYLSTVGGLLGLDFTIHILNN